MASFTDALGRKTSLDYSVPGRTAVTDPLGFVTCYGYDGAGQLTYITGPAVDGGSQLARFYYDANGNLARATDARGLDTVYTYDLNGNRTLERDAAGNTVARAYNPVTNALLAEARYLVPDPDGAGAGAPGAPASTRYTYDANGRPHYVISPEGRLTEYRYNGLGELISELHYDSQFVATAGWGPLEAPSDGAMNTLVAAPGFDKSRVSRTDYGYDARGLRASATRYATTAGDGSAVLDGQQSVTRYVYDQAGQLLRSFDGNNNQSTVSYDGLGRVLSRTDALGNTVLNAYDAQSNLSVTVRGANSATASSVTSYVHDNAGQLVAVQQLVGQTFGSVFNSYDADGRLRMSTAASGRQTWWLYDAAGRKVAQIEHNGMLTEYVYNQDNQARQDHRLHQHGGHGRPDRRPGPPAGRDAGRPAPGRQPGHAGPRGLEQLRQRGAPGGQRGRQRLPGALRLRRRLAPGADHAPRRAGQRGRARRPGHRGRLRGRGLGR